MWALVTKLPPEGALMRVLADQPHQPQQPRRSGTKRVTTDPQEMAAFFGRILQTA